WIERAPRLARRVIGEVARLDQLRPERGFTEAALGEETVFACDLVADFEGIGDAPGFDAVRIRTGSRARFIRLEMGDPLQAVDPAAVTEGHQALAVVLPRRIEPNRAEPVRVVFGTEIFTYATTFEGEVFDSVDETLPQPVEPGDASTAVGTSSLRVLGSSRSASMIQELALSSPVFTPNGDAVNDQLTVSYTLFRLPEPVPVELRVYTLDGRLAAERAAGDQMSGPQRATWDGRDNHSALLPPGLYLIEVALQSESAVGRGLRPVGLAY
ncbi:MAG: hypothetical protein QGH25_11970, partial [Candidatus Latescibacteria bacterium]|nr:hypothetical protein [Candidatus Latescibacterota bacterium]